MTGKIKTLDQLKKLDGKIFVRWSKSFSKDRTRGYSLRFGNQVEAGLSCNNLDQTWEDWRILRALTEYAFTFAPHCWIVTGDEVARGGDDEPLLQNVILLGEVDQSLLATDWKKMRLEARIAQSKDSFENTKDPIYKKIAEKDLYRYSELLKKHLAGDTFIFVD